MINIKNILTMIKIDGILKSEKDNSNDTERRRRR